MIDPVEIEAVAQIATGLTKAHFSFLDDIYAGRKPRLADRAEDKVRQKCRRLGLVAWCGKPVRWQISALGLAVRAHLETLHD